MSARQAEGMPERGRLIVVTAPSGAGKTTLVRALLKRRPDIEFSISYTTRPARAAEVDGRDYFFVDAETFAGLVRRGALLEHANVFDHWYGTSAEQVEARLAAGATVLLEIDWQGARQVRERLPEALTVFILPPSLEELERRLRGRRTDSEATIRRRLRDAREDLSHWSEFDYAVVNDDVDSAADELATIVAGRGEHSRTDSPRLREAVGAITSRAGAGPSGAGP